MKKTPLLVTLVTLCVVYAGLIPLFWTHLQSADLSAYGYCWNIFVSLWVGGLFVAAIWHREIGDPKVRLFFGHMAPSLFGLAVIVGVHKIVDFADKNHILLSSHFWLCAGSALVSGMLLGATLAILWPKKQVVEKTEK